MRPNRYRRDQRQLDEEEEMWFNEDDDFDEGEAVVPATNSSLINKKLNSELEAIGECTPWLLDGAGWTCFL